MRHDMCHLAYLFDPFWVLREEDLETLQFLGQTLDIIQSINTDNNLLALKLCFQAPSPFENTGFLDSFNESVWVDTDWESSNLCESSFEVDSIRFSLETEDSGAG